MIIMETEQPEIFQKVIKEAISRIEDKQQEEDDKKEAEKLRQKFLKKYLDIFTKKLKKGYVIDCNPVKIETKKNHNIKPVNCRTPIPIPLHFPKPANQELKYYLQAGIIEGCHH